MTGPGRAPEGEPPAGDRARQQPEHRTGTRCLLKPCSLSMSFRTQHFTFLSAIFYVLCTESVLQQSLIFLHQTSCWELLAAHFYRSLQDTGTQILPPFRQSPRSVPAHPQCSPHHTPAPSSQGHSPAPCFTYTHPACCPQGAQTQSQALVGCPQFGNVKSSRVPHIYFEINYLSKDKKG